jgi:mRNA interferase RelE/StbE
VTYRLEFTPAADQQFRKLPAQLQARLKPHIDALAHNPRPPGVEKLTGQNNAYRLRVGDYRVLYEVHDILCAARNCGFPVILSAAKNLSPAPPKQRDSSLRSAPFRMTPLVRLEKKSAIRARGQYKRLLVLVVKIGHRREVYRKR